MQLLLYITLHLGAYTSTLQTDLPSIYTVANFPKGLFSVTYNYFCVDERLKHIQESMLWKVRTYM